MNQRNRNIVFYLLIIVVILVLSAAACMSQSELQPTADLTALQPTNTIEPSETATIAPSVTATKLPTATAPSESSTSMMETNPSLPTRTLSPPTSALPTMTLSPPAPNLSFLGIEIAGEFDLTPVEQSGVYWVRRNGIKWHEVEPTEGQRDWQVLSDIETELQALNEQDQEVILVVRGTPNWAQKVPGYYCGPIKEDKLQAYGDFISELVARYGVPPYNIKYWELGNEPDVDPALVTPNMVFGCWGDPEDDYYGGGYYAEMLKVVYPIIKEADPDAQVLLGGFLLICDPVDPPETQPGSGEYRDCKASRYLEGILENGGGDYFDGVSFHAYDYYFQSLGHYGNTLWHSSWRSTGPVLIAKGDYIRDTLEQYGYTEKFLVNSEIGLICGATGEEDFCMAEEFQRTKANYVLQAHAAAKAEGLLANVWYSMRGWRGSSLIVKNGDPLPAYKAFQFAVEQFEDVDYVGEVKNYPGIMGYEFERGDGHFWVIWALDDESHTVILPGLPSAVYDSVGNELSAEKTLTITLEPVYVEWLP